MHTEAKIRQQLEEKYKALEMISIKHLEAELLISNSEAKILADQFIKQDKVPREVFINIVILALESHQYTYTYKTWESIDSTKQRAGVGSQVMRNKFYKKYLWTKKSIKKF